MAASETIHRYIDALIARGDYARFFAPDVRCSIEGTDQAATGPAEAEQMIRFMHEQAFDARPELKTLVVEGNHAAIEADFVGVHTGDFAGVPATGRSVRVPYAVVYDLEGETIKALRLYMPMQALVAQLTEETAAVTA
jgi:predicted ester cyclase